MLTHQRIESRWFEQVLPSVQFSNLQVLHSSKFADSPRVTTKSSATLKAQTLTSLILNRLQLVVKATFLATTLMHTSLNKQVVWNFTLLLKRHQSFSSFTKQICKVGNFVNKFFKKRESLSKQAELFVFVRKLNVRPDPYFFKKWAIPGFFFLYFRLFNTQLIDSKQMFNIYKVLPMTGFELQTSGFGSDHTTNWATPLARSVFLER